MLSFKSITGFLKKVSSSGRDDVGKDQKQKSGADGGGGAGASGSTSSTPGSNANNVNNSTGGAGGGWSGSAGDGAGNARGSTASRTSAGGFAAHHGGRKSDDTAFIESPLFGMPSAFGDASMFASAGILKGLAPNTSTQDVLRHIQRVVQQRSAELQQHEDAQAEEEERELGDRANDAESQSAVKGRGTAARASFKVASTRSSHSLASTAAPSPSEVPLATTSGARPAAALTSAPHEGKKEGKAGQATTMQSPTTPNAPSTKEGLRLLQQIRGEMIDALDVCLQEVPEDTPAAVVAPASDAAAAAVAAATLTDDERARQEKTGEGRASLNAAAAVAGEGVTRSNSVVLSPFSNGLVALSDSPAAAAVVAGSERAAALEGLGIDVEAATPRNASIIATPVETAETSMAAVPRPDTPVQSQTNPNASSPPATTAAAPASTPTVFTHYEWRCLLLQVVEVIVRIDCAVMQDVRRRATDTLSPGIGVSKNAAAAAAMAAAAAGGGASTTTTEYRWHRLSQVLPAPTEKTVQTPLRQPQQVDVAASAALLNSPHLLMSRSEALLRTPDDAESLTLPLPATLLTSMSGQATPTDTPLPPGGSTTSTAAGTTLPSPIAKMKHALIESGILSVDSRVDYSISKEDKKLLEELLTVACSLATWAIIKAILRHHLQVIVANRQRAARRATVGSGGALLGGSLGCSGHAVTSATSERAVLEMSLSATTTELGTTGNSLASTNGGRPPLAPMPPPVLTSSIGTTNAAAAAAVDEGTAGEDGAAGASTTAPAWKASAEGSEASEDVPYIAWEAVVEELDAWMGGSPGHIIAECTLCASFLRDDGREMVMCMLQKPKPRHLLSNIHRHAEKLRHTDPTALVVAPAAPPIASPRGTAGAAAVQQQQQQQQQIASSSSSSTSATGTSALSPSSTTPAPSANTAGSAGTSGSPSAAAAATGGSASGGNATGSSGAAANTAVGAGASAAATVPPSPTVGKGVPAVSTSVQAMMDDPTLVMDDLVAQLEHVYRKAVGDTWSSFLETAIENEIANVQVVVPRQASECPSGDRAAGEEDAVSPPPQSAYNAYNDDPLPKQASGTSTQSSPSAPSSPITKAYITDTKTLCRLATAYFFGSDTWSERKRERRFAVLYRSMRSRMEQYSESAATRRNIRRGTSAAASPTQTATTTAVASPVEVGPTCEPPSPAASQTPRNSLGANVSAARASPSLPTTTSAPPTTYAAAVTSGGSGGNASAAAGGQTPAKFSVEDTSSRPTAAAAAASTLSQPVQNASSPSPRHGLLNTQLVAHQLLSSNASNAAASTHSTPLAGSLQISRDGAACSDADVSSSVLHADARQPHGAASPSGPERYSIPQADQPATWMPFGFIITPSGTITPPPEHEHYGGHLQPQASVGGATPIRSDGDSNVASFAGGMHGLSSPYVALGGTSPSGVSTLPPPPPAAPASASATPPLQQQQQQPTVASTVGHPLSAIVMERIVNMSWSAALHKRGEQCLSAKPPRLEEAEQNAQEERLVAGAFGEFRARQRSLVSLINARLASGKSVEALLNAQKHFRFEKKDWTSHGQTIFSALRYLQSMVLLVRAQAACRVYGAVIETVQLVLPQATLCEQMLKVLAPRPRKDCIIRFAECRAKLLRSFVYLLKECWLAHAAFNDHAKAAKYFSQCAQVLQMLRRRSRESELFAAYMERGSQLMKMKDYNKSVELFRLAVNIAKKSLQDADAAAAAAAAAANSSAAPSLASTVTSAANVLSLTTSGGAKVTGGAAAGATAAVPSPQFHRNLHFRGAGSGQLYTAEEHNVGTSAATADDLEFTWRVAESERMLALSYVTEAEHEVNVRERREELSNAVSNAYSSQRSLQRWQAKGGTPKRLLTAVPCSLIVICKGLLLLNQARKAALLLEPLIENKPSSALVRPPMWREILDPTEDPYTAEDVVLRTYVCSVKIAVYMLYARCLAEFDGERALRAVTQVDQLLQESDAWIYAVRTKLRRALEEVRGKDANVATVPTTPCTARSLQLPRRCAPAGAGNAAMKSTNNNEDNDDTLSTTRPGGGGADTVVSAASTTATAGTGHVGPAMPAASGASSAAGRTTEVPPLRMYNMANNASSASVSNATGSPAVAAPSDGTHQAARLPPSGSVGSHQSPDYNSPEEAPLRQRRSQVAGMAGTNSIAPSREDLQREEEEQSRQSTLMQTSAGSVNADLWSYSNANVSGMAPAAAVSHTSTTQLNLASTTNAGATAAPTLRIQMESTSEIMTALFALREGKSHIRKALRDIFIVSGDAHSLIKNWEEALKSYSHALVISMGEVEAANAAAQSRRRVSHFATPRTGAPSPRTSNVNGGGGGSGGGGGLQDECGSTATSQAATNATGAASVSHHATAGSAGSVRTAGAAGTANNTAHLNATTGSSHNGGGGAASDTRGGAANTVASAAPSSSSAQCWGQVVPLDEEFFLWDEEDVLIADNMVNRDLTSSTAAKDLRAVVADEERMDSRACESLVLSKLANVYRALDKPTTAIHYHNLVMDYANECSDKLLAYNSMLSLARLYTASASQDAARESWAKVSDLAKEYEDKEVSRETKRNIVAGQESAGMYLDVVKTAEELEKLATGEEGEDAAADRRFALEALANANLQLGQYDACIAALDNREKVQEKSAEWNGRLLSMRAKARMGLNKPTEAIKVMQSWAVKARNLGNWVELGKASSALSAAYASENQNMQARHYHEATLHAFALAETLSEDCQHIALDSARWLVHYAYLDDGTVQIDPALTFSGGCLTSDSEASGGDFRYTDSGLCNSSGDLGEMLAKEEELRRSSSSLLADGMRGHISGNSIDNDDDDDDFFGSGGTLSNRSLFGMRLPAPSAGEEKEGPDTAAAAAAAMTAEDGEEDASTTDAANNESAGEEGREDQTAEGNDGSFDGANAGNGDDDDDDGPLLQRHSSSSFHAKDPTCATQPPSLAASMNPSMHEFPAQQDAFELNYSGSSAGQSEVGDSDAVAEELEDETRRRREVDEALRTMDDDVDAGDHSSAVAAAVAAAAQNNMFFNMVVDDDDASNEDEEGAEGRSPSESPSASAAEGAKRAVKTPPMPNITTAAVKSTTNATAAGGNKSASSNYVPPPTALANVSICSRPAAAAAGTDVLEMPVKTGRSMSEPGSGAGLSATGSPLIAGGGRSAGGGGGGAFGDGAAPSAAAAASGGAGGTSGGAAMQQDGEEGHLERKPAAVRTTYFRGAIEMMETAAQLLLVPRSVSRLVVPYSPAEAVDFALLAHPHSLFVFYFAEYTTEYGAQCDVVVRPPGTAGFLKLRTQISLKEYHSKDVVSSLLTTLSAETSVVAERGTSSIAGGNHNNNNAIDMAATSASAHPFGNAMAKATASASPTLSSVRPDALRAALDEETQSCLRNLHADAWQPIIERMRREKVSYQDAETVIIMPDIALLHLPFAGLLPSPDYGGEEAPLGEQFTLVVTPSLTHFVYHGMSKQHPLDRTCGVLDPNACRYVFVPYDAAGAVGNAHGPSLPSSPRLRQQTTQPARNPTTPRSGGGAAAIKAANSMSSAESTLTAQTSAVAAMGNPASSAARRESAPAAAAAAAAAPGGAAPWECAAAAGDDGTFDGILRTWKVHRGCTRKELIHAFTDCQTRALMFLGPIDQGGVRVADGVVTMQDIMTSLQQARSQQAAQANALPLGAGAAAAAASSPAIPQPPLCTHVDLLLLTADRGFYPSVTNGGTAANLCMSLGCHRVLRLNVIHGLAPNDEHREFIANFYTNLRKVVRWSLSNPYAVALRTTIAEARAKGMSSNTWGAFTLIGSA